MQLTARVGVTALRCALQAILPHVEKNDELDELHRLRFEVDGTGALLVMATDRFTAAVYSLDTLEVTPDGVSFFDITPADARKVLAVFRAEKEDDPAYPDHVIEITAGEKNLRLRDVSGLFPDGATELELPATTPSLMWPNLPKLLGGLLGSPPTARLHQVAAAYLRRFAESGKSVTGAMVLRPAGRSMLITSGEEFLGALMPQTIADEQAQEIESNELSWRTLLTDLGVEVANRNPLPEQLDNRLTKAVRHVVERQAVTVKGLRDTFGLGGKEADALMAELERHGIIGPKDGRKAREILIAPEEVDQAIGVIAASERAEHVEILNLATDDQVNAFIEQTRYPTAVEMAYQEGTAGFVHLANEVVEAAESDSPASDPVTGSGDAGQDAPYPERVNQASPFSGGEVVPFPAAVSPFGVIEYVDPFTPPDDVA